jgi:ribosomal protein S18 acetylase RimI-like enzyme
VEIRRLRPDEWRALRDIRLRALADAPDAFGATLDEDSTTTDAEWQSRAGQSDRAIFVVDGPDGLVAMASGGRAPNVADTAALYGMWVDPSARRQGLGSALVEAVKAWAIAEGYPRFGLGVTTTNAAAIALYEHLGFVDVGDRYPLREGTDLVIQIMAMPLP